MLNRSQTLHHPALRIGLYVLLGLTTYGLILAWGNHQNPHVTLEQPVEQAVASTPEIASTSTSTSPRESSAHANALVSINTDLLQLQVERQGGDIIQALLNQYSVAPNNPNPIHLLMNSAGHHYIVQSGLGGRDGFDVRAGERPLYQVEQLNYNMHPQSDTLSVPMSYSQNGVEVTKTYHFKNNSYLIEVQHKVVNGSQAPLHLGQFGIIRRDSLEPLEGNSSGLGLAGYVGGAVTVAEDPFLKLEFDDIEETPFVSNNVPAGWIAVLQRYFMSAWIPDPDQVYNYRARQLNSTARYQFGFFSAQDIRIDPGQEYVFSSHLYLGPKIYAELNQIAPNLELTVDYGWLFFIGEPLFKGLLYLHSYTNNWGWSIVLLTLLVKIAFFWLSNMGYRSTSRMRLLGPKLTELRERFPDDRQKQMQESMGLYKKHKVNPLGGCLPLLIPMPIFIALYWVLVESVELRQAHFALWISDLSVPDPYYALPLFMGASMLVMQNLSPPPPNMDPMQARMLKFMPVMFTLFFLWFPAGLVLYWLVNNLFSMTHQFVVNRNAQRRGL